MCSVVSAGQLLRSSVASPSITDTGTGIVRDRALQRRCGKKRNEKTFVGVCPARVQFLFDWSRRIPGLNDNLYEKYKVLSDVFANGPGAVTEELSRRNDFYDQSILNGPLIAYIPDDPLHPLKEYPSLTAFMKALATQLLETPISSFSAGLWLKKTNRDSSNGPTSASRKSPGISVNRWTWGHGGGKRRLKIRMPSRSPCRFRTISGAPVSAQKGQGDR